MVGTPAVAHYVTVYYVLYKWRHGRVHIRPHHFLFLLRVWAALPQLIVLWCELCQCDVRRVPRTDYSLLIRFASRRVPPAPTKLARVGPAWAQIISGRQLCHVMPVANRHRHIRHCAKYVACRGQFPVAFKFACSLQSARPGRNNFARSVEVGFLVWCRCNCKVLWQPIPLCHDLRAYLATETYCA